MHPVQVHLHEAARRLQIDWSDGVTTHYALTYLRGWCPCAKCQGHFSGTYRFVDVPGVRLLDVDAVGSYAIQPSWSDGHSSGIYAFTYLRQIALAPPADGPTNAEIEVREASP